MRPRLWLALTGFALLFHPPLAPAAARGTKLFFWKATSPTTEVYLLGSIHLGKKEMYPLAKEIEGAFDKSKFLVLEADLSKVDNVKIQQMVFEKGIYGGEDTLAKHVPAETFKGVSDLAATLGVPVASVEKMKPWFLAMTLTLISIQKLGYSPEFGIDKHFTGEAKDKGKEILEVESMEFQLNLLAGLSEELQAKFLASTVDEAANTKERMEKILEAWTKGDLATFDQEMIKKPREKHPEQAEFHVKMIDDRNAGMARKIGEYLKTKDVHFVVLGAAHMIGEKGVVRLLEKDGFKVEQVESP
jgi:uncharacterized protein YbaP (TraB family)